MVPIQIKTERRRWVAVRGHARLVMGPRQTYAWRSIRRMKGDEVSSWDSFHEVCLALVRLSGQEQR